MIMLFVHQVHKLRRSDLRTFEGVVRDELLPAVAASPATRLIWYASSTDAAGYPHEALTMIAVEDATALEQFGERCRTGDLAAVSTRLSELRMGVETRITKSLRFDPLVVDLASVPVKPIEHETISYMHDFVPPRIGMRRAYEEGMVKIYMAMSDTTLLDIALWAGLEPIAGPIPEQINISRIKNINGLLGLVTKEFPRDNKQLGSWMFDALKLRDHWTTRLVRCAPWSPLY
jgi:hypothetical protein